MNKKGSGGIGPSFVLLLGLGTAAIAALLLARARSLPLPAPPPEPSPPAPPPPPVVPPTFPAFAVAAPGQPLALVHKDPAFSSPAIDALNPGAPVTVDQKSTTPGWVHVTYRTQLFPFNAGFMSIEEVSFQDPSSRLRSSPSISSRLRSTSA